MRSLIDRVKFYEHYDIEEKLLCVLYSISKGL